MDFFENVVLEYLRADRALFINSQCCIQINESDNPDTSGPHWYCDAVVADFRLSTIFLCEITYADPPSSLLKRLQGWNEHWSLVCKALSRDSHLPQDWPVRPWLFVRESIVSKILSALESIRLSISNKPGLPDPKITTLEMVSPWLYKSWNRIGEAVKPAIVPEIMR